MTARDGGNLDTLQQWVVARDDRAGDLQQLEQQLAAEMHKSAGLQEQVAALKGENAALKICAKELALLANAIAASCQEQHGGED